jgi:hypothetical protein
VDYQAKVRVVGRAECFKVVQNGLESADKKNANGDAQDGQCRPARVPDCILQDEPDNLHRGSPVAQIPPQGFATLRQSSAALTVNAEEN